MVPSFEEIMSRVSAIAPILRANAAACVSARRVVPESMAAMVEAGLFKICQPARVGGYEMSLKVQSAVITALSRVCPSSGWIVMVMGAHHFCLASWPERAQEEVFGGGKQGLVAGTLAWQGKAQAVEGGYRVDGRWQFCSGVDNSNWIMLGCADAERGGPGVHVVVPKEEVIVDDTWYVMGMEGTGSKDVVAKNLMVPAYRAIDTRQLMTGSSPHTLNHATPVYRVSADSMLSSSIPAAVLGSAQFALEKFIERTKERRVIISGARKAEHGPTQLRLAEATAELRCAELLLSDAIQVLDDVANSGNSATDMEYRARVKWQAAYSTELCRRAVTRLFAGSGAHAIYRSLPLEAAFRNVHVGAQHASIDFDTSAELYGRMRLGLLSSQH